MMDLIKIGNFLAQLRKENSLTQEALGEMIGVTNKTVSRWETGTYLPPVEMLQMLSSTYSVSINELLSGERLSKDSYRTKAEENLKTVISNSVFCLNDKITYFKNKWKKDNLFYIILSAITLIGLAVLGFCLDNVLQIIALIAAPALYMFFHNKMMIYVEGHIFGNQGK